MSKDIIYFAENICGIKLVDWQKDLLRQRQEANDKGELILVNLGRRQGRQLVNNILINFQIWSKNQQIAILEKALELACMEFHCELENPDNELYDKSLEQCIDYFKNRAKEIKNE